MCRLLTLLLTIFLFASVAAAEVRQEYRDLIPRSRVVINTPSEIQFRKGRPVRLILYALPNGNTIEETEGRGGALLPEEWRYDIQHIAAQVRFLRENDRRYNYIVAYLEAEQKGWTIHASEYADSPGLYKKLTDTIVTIVKSSLPGKLESGGISVALSSHSGGGRFVLNYIHSVDKIPSFIDRILFIDSNYGYDEELHTDKLVTWLKADKNRHLGVMAYVDTTVILNGRRIVSSRGGTGFRSAMMARDLQKRGVKFTERSDTSFVRKFSKNGQVAFWTKENPNGKIYHTILVERNGLIHQMLFDSGLDGKGYKFWGVRCYDKYIK
jgi:hypothetical protein